MNIFLGNYIRVDTAIQNNKNYLYQQPKQLVSTTCAAINSLPRLKIEKNDSDI